MEKLKDKKIAFVLIAVVLLVVLVVGLVFMLKGDKNTKNNEPSFKENKNVNVIKDQKLGVYDFTNVQLYYTDGNSVFKASVTNTAKNTENLQEFKIHVYDKDHKEIVTLTGFVGDKMDAGETRSIESSYAGDLTDADSVEYELIK